MLHPAIALLFLPVLVLADEGQSVEQVADGARKSVVVITFKGRDGQRQGLGTGFVVAADGLIATNLHVLGEARPITVRLNDGKRYDVQSIHASDRALDLALIRIDAKNLVPLELGDSDKLRDGRPVVGLGNPLGLTNSVVSGVVSAKREIEGRPMIQLAIPIEPGNSGGPLLDRQGRVQGILTMKSAVTSNLGFAVPINQLKTLLKKPNPIPMARWLTIGALDPADWTTVFDANWMQRAGKILAEGFGSGFGGRSLCLSQHALPELPFEVAVTVRLDNEAGAAGLVFHADGHDKHYGFYPSGGQLRLTRFDGADVFSWTILKQQPSQFYRPGEWNTLRVRLEPKKFSCYVNNHLIVESADSGLTGGKVGLAKFRDTRAEFKQFQIAKQIRTVALSADLMRRVNQSVARLSAQEAPPADLVDALLPEAVAGVTALRDRARSLESEANRLRDLAAAVHQKRVQNELLQALHSSEQNIDLIHAALLIAQLDNDELDVDAYRNEVDRMAREVKAALPKNSNDKDKLAALQKYLFAEHGFHGSRTDYYNRANSYLSEVLDDREGLPITLSVLYMELARRIGLPVVGIGLPGHFIVQFRPDRGEPQFIDVYEGARGLTREAAEEKSRAITEHTPPQEYFNPVRKKDIVLRILQNLLGITRQEGDVKGALRYLDTMLVISPDAADERLARAAARFQAGDRQGSLDDLNWLVDHPVKGMNRERILELRRVLTRPER
jgi:regulator of sirC expression with transglutaminase-like and TPR domain